MTNETNDGTDRTYGAVLRDVRDKGKAAGDTEITRLASVVLDDAWPEAPTECDRERALDALAAALPDNPHLQHSTYGVGRNTVNAVLDLPCFLDTFSVPGDCLGAHLKRTPETRI